MNEARITTEAPEIGAEVQQAAYQVLLVTPDLGRQKELISRLQRPDWSLTRRYIGTEALRQIATGRYDILILDKELSDIPSTDLLQVVKNKFPWVKVAIFGPRKATGFAAEAVALGLDAYLGLPANDSEITALCEQLIAAAKRDNAGRSKSVDLIVALRSLPAVPRIVLKLWEFLDSGEDAVHKVVSIVRNDPGLTAMILRVANSVRFGVRQRIRSLERAISLIGLDELRSLSVVHSTRQVFHKSTAGGRFDLNRYWAHSVRVALTAERLAKEYGDLKPGHAFAAGLLHDLGILVLVEIYQDTYDRVLEVMEELEIERCQVESDLLGIDHTRAGGILCRHWNLPEYLFDPIHYHHQPDQAVDQLRLTGLVHLADVLVSRLDTLPGSQSLLRNPNSSVLVALGLNADELDGQIESLRGYLEESVRAYSELLHRS